MTSRTTRYGSPPPPPPAGRGATSDRLPPRRVRVPAAGPPPTLEPTRRHKRLVTDPRGPLDRHIISRIVHRVGRAARVPGVPPHRLRHTLATQAINRGMRLEAIAALLG